MDDIPKNSVGKALRLNFCCRLNIPTIPTNEEVTPSQLLYEAQCTSNATTFDVISFRAVELSVDDVIKTMKNHPQIKTCAAYRNSVSNKFYLFIVSNDESDEGLVQNVGTFLHSHVHEYMLPTDIIIVPEHLINNGQSIDDRTLENLVRQQQATTDDPVTLVLCDIFGLVFGVPKDSEGNVTRFPADGNFLDYGGNSLKSGLITSLIRRKLGVALPAAIFFEENYRTPIALAAKCHEKMSKDHILLTYGYDKFLMQEEENVDVNEEFGNSSYKKRMNLRPPSGAKNPFNPLIMLFQGSPLYLMQPLAHMIRWTFVIHILGLLSSSIRKISNNEVPKLVPLLIALLITSITSEVVFPMIGIIMKWLVIGRYRAGTYPLWSGYYLRWWFINKLLLVFGVGIFRLHYLLFALYLRLMGASVGQNSRISCDADIKEYDLITIGSDCYVDNCVIRPFMLTRGHMNLSSVIIGDRCVLGFRTHIVAGTRLENGTVLGPQTTTYTRDMQAGNGSTAHIGTVEGTKLRDLCRETFPEPHYILEFLVGWPFVIVVHAVSHIPWFYCLHLLTMEISSSRSANFADIIEQFADPKRIECFILARFVKNYVVRLLYIILVILIKRLIIGKFENGPRKLDQLSLMRHWLMKTLLTKQTWLALAHIVGTHYEIISVIYRLLGAKVGKRVYWPGTNIHLVEYDLLSVGNDVVFGSRSQILCGDAAEYASVTIEDGGMCGDNCVILPGSCIGRNTVLGTGGLLKKHFKLADGSVWFGSLNGNAVKLRDSAIITKSVEENGKTIGHIMASNTTGISDDDDTMKPFGRAFYERKANYFVFPLSLIVFYNLILFFAGAILWSLPSLTALQITAAYIRFTSVAGIYCSEEIIILVLFGATSIFNVLTCTLALFLELIAKWALLGRRQEGTFNWDKSSYCQRWQVFLDIQHIVGTTALVLLGGSSWIVLFYRAMGCKIGKRVCLYPNTGEPAMTEPDMVVLEDDVAVDKAALTAHLNTLGEFTIDKVRVGAGSVLQNYSRLAPGATMLEDCTLLDFSYIMPGEKAEANSVWQGYPGVITSIEESYSMYAEKKSK